MRPARFLLVLLFLYMAAPALAADGVMVSGRILDTQGGLPVPNAEVELDRGGQKVAVATTDATGSFTIRGISTGTYVVLVRANGYEATRLTPDLLVNSEATRVSFQMAISRQRQGLKQIGYVLAGGRTALQTTTTINTHIDASILQSESFQRLGDVLTTVPGVITSTSSSVGDDMSLSIRGYDSTETATLLDGHPIGPVGAFGNGYNYNVSPFWGLSAADVVFGSGATGLFGATTIAGAVNFLTINPTQGNHLSVTQGVGSDNKAMTGLLGTGTIGHLGYAVAWGTQGTTGNFPGGYIQQTALLQTSVVNPGYKGSAPPPDLTHPNAYNLVNTYPVSGGYVQRNFVGKLIYSFSPKTTLQFTAYSANDWSNSTGEGDNDYETYPYVLYGAQQTLAGIKASGGRDTILVNGTPRTCHDSIAVLIDNPAGYTCMTPAQYAVNFYGPFGGSIDRWRTLGNQDYDARATQQLGAGTITLEGFVDAYNYNEQKGPGAPIGPYGPGPNYLNLYSNRGYLLSDDFAMSKNDFGFGYTWLHQSNTNGQFPYSLPSGVTYNTFGTNPPLYLATASYFLKDAWTPNDKFSAFGSFWIQRSLDTSSTHFDPRLSFIFRPDPSDVIRLTGGRSYSEPDPSLIAFAPPVYGAPSSINCPPTTTGTGALVSIASVANPLLQPETAEDLELAYGHRFNATTNIQADVYQSWESQALLNGNVSIVGFPGITVPQDYIDKALQRLSSCPGLNPTEKNLAFSTTYNAAGARYRGIVLSTNVGITRNVGFNAAFDVQSASYVGIPQDILIANTDLLDGGQIAKVPLRQGTAGIYYQDNLGIGARLDATYIGNNNTWNRNAFWFANASVSKASGPVTINLGVYNLFNSVAQQYGYIGYGLYQPQNYYGLAAQGGATSGIQQSSEQYGLPFRTYWFTVKVGI
ncbi:MAG: TonB-dependent receptor [Candidatus Eremiobacteraeota bacterium]|nr:TonB-dependent receptor [Candidatus Eremiobacteraeota bacterium]MBV8499643.1 TonB-dependent receptor [Candidatus Eremiobacteraeota bacterium]